MLIKITIDGLYSDFEKQPGFVRSRELEAGTVIDFPGEYAGGLVESGLAEFAEGEESEAASLDEPLAFEVVETDQAPKPILEITDPAKRQLDMYDIDPADVTGTGKGGKITLGDANKFVAKHLADLEATHERVSKKMRLND
jgi:pyruvate/2-oxoglutarate dehydrogenase complex dihydrolipoamide acyltransferase (E2) component